MNLVTLRGADVLRYEARQAALFSVEHLHVDLGCGQMGSTLMGPLQK